MNHQLLYRFVVLRYVHDVRTQEFLNVGVLFQIPELHHLEFRHTKIPRRVARTFPGIKERSFLVLLEQVAHAFAQLRNRKTLPKDLIEIAHLGVAMDSSSLQWSTIMAGHTSDPLKTCDSVYERYVATYEAHRVKRVRSDDELWRGLKGSFEAAGVSQRFTSVEIKGAMKSYEFAHALRSDRWHIVRALSLDGCDRDELAEKATSWAGRLLDMRRAEQQFHLSFILGAPPSPLLSSAFRDAKSLLSECVESNRIRFVDEAEVETVVQELSRELLA